MQNNKKIQKYSLEHSKDYAQTLAEHKFMDYGAKVFTESHTDYAQNVLSFTSQSTGQKCRPIGAEEYGYVMSVMVGKSETIEQLKSKYAESYTQDVEEDLIKIQNFYEAFINAVIENNLHSTKWAVQVKRDRIAKDIAKTLDK